MFPWVSRCCGKATPGWKGLLGSSAPKDTFVSKPAGWVWPGKGSKERADISGSKFTVALFHISRGAKSSLITQMSQNQTFLFGSEGPSYDELVCLVSRLV